MSFTSAVLGLIDAINPVSYDFLFLSPNIRCLGIIFPNEVHSYIFPIIKRSIRPTRLGKMTGYSMSMDKEKPFGNFNSSTLMKQLSISQQTPDRRDFLHIAKSVIGASFRIDYSSNIGFRLVTMVVDQPLKNQSILYCLFQLMLLQSLFQVGPWNGDR